MKKTSKISSMQFFLMLFLSRAVISLTINSQTVGEANFLDNILSSLILFAALFLFVWPLFSLNKSYENQSLPAIAEKQYGGIGYGVSIIYSLYFLVMNTFSLALFLTLLSNTMNPAASRWSIVVILTGIALYGAVKGIETISRASICIFVLFLLGFGVIFTALIARMETGYLEPVLSEGTQQMQQGALVFASRCTSLAEVAVLMPFVRGKKKLGFALWNGGVTAFVSVLLFFLVTCLGEYAYRQIFPVYTLATMAEIAGIQRLDALLAGLSMMALVIRLSCGLFAVSECWARTVKPRPRVWLLSVIAVISVGAALWITENAERTGLIFRTGWLLPMTALTGIVLPVVIWAADRIKNRRKCV